MSRRRTIPCLVLGAAYAACGPVGETNDPTGFTVRDSAGIQIAENRGVPPESIVVDGAPRLDLGVADGAPMFQFSGIVGAAINSDGEIVVANAGTAELRFFDRDGTFLRSVGRRGEGPGEFVALASLFLRGDSLVAHDRRSWRFTVFDPTGEFIGMTPPGGLFLGLLGDGTLIGYDVTTREMPEPGSVTRSRGILLRYEPDGTASDTIATLEMNDRYVHTEIPGFSERMFGRTTQFLFSDDRILLADNAAYEFRELRPDGSVARVIRRDRPLRPVTDPDVTAYIARAGARYGDDPRREMFDRTLRDQPPAASMPAFGRSGLIRTELPPVQQSATGDLWVLDYVAFPEEPETWNVFDHRGHLRGTVVLPPGVEIAHIASNEIIAVTRDGLDVEHVLLFDFSGFDTGGR